MRKSDLRDAILEKLRQELALQASAAALARDEAISEESQPENKWDTHSQEAAYLAEGQAKLAAEIAANLEYYASFAFPDLRPDDPITLGALVELEADGQRAHYFVGPRAGGLELTVDGRDILVLTPQSPLGRLLIGKRVGEIVQPTGRGALPPQRIAAVS